MRPLLSILSILVLSLVGFVFGQAGGKSVMGGNAVMGGGERLSLRRQSFNSLLRLELSLPILRRQLHSPRSYPHT